MYVSKSQIRACDVLAIYYFSSQQVMFYNTNRPRMKHVLHSYKSDRVCQLIFIT